MGENLIGAHLIEAGLLSQENLEKALSLQEKQQQYIGYLLIKNQFINPKQFIKFIDKNPTEEEKSLLALGLTKDIVQKVAPSITWSYQACPLAEVNNKLIVGFAFVPEETFINSLSLLFEKDIKPLICAKRTVYQAMIKYFPLEPDKGTILPVESERGLFILSEEKEKIQPKNITNLQIQDTASEWLRSILVDAIKNKSKKIMIFKKQQQSIIEYDKRERPFFPLPVSVYKRLQRVLCALASLHAALRYNQRGFVDLRIKEKNVLLIVESIPDMQGINFKLEFFDEKVLHTEYKHIENNYPESIQLLQGFLMKEYGLFAIGSPSAADRAFTLYPLLDKIKEKYKCVLIEDVITYPIEGIQQIEASPADSAPYEQIISEVTKKPSDVIIIAPATQKKLMELAFLLATHRKIIALMHAFDGAKVLEWFIKMGFRSAMKAEVLKGILFFRNITRICHTCKIKFPIDNFITIETTEDMDFYTNGGCSFCQDPLSSDKVLLIETIPIDPRVISIITQKDSAESIRNAMKESNIKLLSQTALRLASKGLVDSREILSLVK